MYQLEARPPGRGTLVDHEDAAAVGKHTRVEASLAEPEPSWEDIPPEEVFQTDAERAGRTPEAEAHAGHAELHTQDHADDKQDALAALPPRPEQAHAAGHQRLECADPFVLVDGQSWFLYGTGLTVHESKDQGKTWIDHGRMMPLTGFSIAWAPEVHKVAGKFVAYMSLQRAGVDLHTKIYCATSDNPVTGWTDLHPIASSNQWANIDPTFFHDPKTGKNYLIYKEDKNPLLGRKRIVEHELDATGTNEVGHGPPRPLLTAGVGAHSGWERRPPPRPPLWSVEAPTLELHDGKYWLFYSGAGFERGGGYAVGAAWSNSITGPFHRVAHPILRGHNGLRQPGHQAIIKVTIGGKTHWILFFHARANQGETRYLHEAEIVWVHGEPQVRRGSIV
jgi:GH43 family beta-xylosidase